MGSDTPTLPEADYFTDTQVAVMLGKHPVSLRRWRRLNKLAGAIKHGPPYERRGARVVYPKQQFREWCAMLEVVDGVPRMNLPVTATIPLPDRTDQRSTVTETADG